jgi:hypothetical protein
MGAASPLQQTAAPSTSRKKAARVTRQLELFALRCLEIADRVAANEIPFLDAIDLLYEGARWGGLVESFNDDIIQATMAAGFANARRP